MRPDVEHYVARDDPDARYLVLPVVKDLAEDPVGGNGALDAQAGRAVHDAHPTARGEEALAKNVDGVPVERPETDGAMEQGQPAGDPALRRDTHLETNGCMIAAPGIDS